MPRKKISFDTEEKDYRSEKKTTKFVERDGRMITNEKIYIFDDKTSAITGVAMANQIVRILEPSISPEHMTKIRTYGTNREGYINSNSVI